MIEESVAQKYASVLHPAFAGYVIDGMITQTDALAIVFYFIKQGYLEPEFEDNNINKKIIALRKMQRKLKYPFEQLIINVIFKLNNRVSAFYIGELINNGIIQTSLQLSSDLVNNIERPLIKYMEGETTFKERVWISTGNLPKMINKKRLVKYLVVSISVFIIAFLLSHRLAVAFICVFVAIGILDFLYPLGHVHAYNINYKIDQRILQYYSQLKEFLTKHPPRPHTFTYDFIPYAIAFGIDRSWHDDFNLDPEIQLKESI